MKYIKRIVLLVMTVMATGLNAQTSDRSLPADIDPLSYSRLPLIYKDSLDAEGQRIFEVINGSETSQARFGPPNSSMYSIGPSEPYDVMNQLLRRASVGPQFFEISTLVPAREFNQQYEWTAHELAAQRVGVDQSIIDVIKYNRPVTGLPGKGRQPLLSLGAQCCEVITRCLQKCLLIWSSCLDVKVRSRSL